MPSRKLLAVFAHPDDESLGVGGTLAEYASQAHQEALWGRQSFYRVFSLVNGGRNKETDLFEGIPNE